jgi:hypothetical protein
MRCRPCSVSAATSAGSRVRTPRSRSCALRNAGMGKAARVAHLARYPTAALSCCQIASAKCQRLMNC